MEEAPSVDKQWKKEAAEAKAAMAEQEGTDTNDVPFVAVVEVKQYLTELSKVLSTISEGIAESIKEMDSRLKEQKNDNKG